jgi:hypothetical protein
MTGEFDTAMLRTAVIRMLDCDPAKVDEAFKGCAALVAMERVSQGVNQGLSNWTPHPVKSSVLRVTTV